MADEDDDEDDERLDINTPFNLPLSEKQREFLKKPEHFSFEEEFYIFYDTLVNEMQGISQSKMLRAIGDNEGAKNAMGHGMDALKAAMYLVKCGTVTMPPIPDGYFFWPDNVLDQEKVAWGREVIKGIKESNVLTQIWLLRLDEIAANARMDWVECVKVEMEALKSTEKYREVHEMLCQVSALEAEHHGAVFDIIWDRYKDFWDNNQVVPQEAINSVFEEYEREHHEEFQFLAARRAAVQKKVSEIVGPPPSEEDTPCDNPNCPIHGVNSPIKGAIANIMQMLRGLESTDNQKPQLKALPSAPPTEPQSLTKEDTRNTMATEKAIEKKKEDEIKFTNMSVQFVNDPNCKHIQLPDGMSLKEGRYWLQKIEEEETRTFIYERKFKGWYPLDAMWAAYKALAELHGFVHVGDFQSMWGPTPPTMMTIDVKYGETQQIPWGPIEVSGFSAQLIPSIELEQGLPTLVFKAKIRNNERAIADKLMKRTEEELKKNSIYRGKAVEVDFTMFHPNDFRFDPTKAPRFWDCSSVSPANLILPDEVQSELNTSLWGPIRKTAQARKHKIPLRRGVLIDGSYGVGKTLAARVTAKLCEDNGWTFLYLKHLDQLEAALYFAKKYEPCVIFAEDVNRIVNGERDAEMDKLFNVMDGVDRKDDEVMVVFTTNNIEEIHAGMLRPGRIDSVIKVTPPDAVAARKLVRLYGRDEDGSDMLEDNIDLTEVGELLAGQIPAIIREAVERSKISAILDTEDNQDVRVKNSHLVTSSRQMLLHAELLKPPAPQKPDLVVLGEAFGNVLATGFKYSVNREHDPALHDPEGKQKNIETGVKKLMEKAGRPDSNGNNNAEA